MADVWTIFKVLDWTRRRFAEQGIANPRLDAELLLARALGCDRVRLYTHHDQPLDAGELERFRELVRARLRGAPVAYLVGEREFWSLKLAVDERVLIPRPETEGVVEAALALIAGRERPRLVDIGTGSGAIAIALAHERPDAAIVAVDRSAAALAVARSNAAAHGVTIEMVEGDLLAPLVGREPFDAIVSNPPYIAEEDYAQLPAEVRREPREALCAAEGGLAVIRRLIEDGRGFLRDDGALVIEIGAGQAGRARAMAEGAGYRDVSTKKDLAGIERVLIAHR